MGRGRGGQTITPLMVLLGPQSYRLSPNSDCRHHIPCRQLATEGKVQPTQSLQSLKGPCGPLWRVIAEYRTTNVNLFTHLLRNCLDIHQQAHQGGTLLIISHHQTKTLNELELLLVTQPSNLITQLARP